MMNILKKITFMLMIILFIGCTDVYAGLNLKNAEIECIYANGVVVGVNYDSVTGQNSAYVKEYPLDASIHIDADITPNIKLIDVPGTVNNSNFSKLQCPSSIKYWIAYEGKGDDRKFTGVYNFGTTVNNDKVTALLIKGKTTGHLWWKETEAINGAIPVWFKEKTICSDGACESNCPTEYYVDAESGIVKRKDNNIECRPEATIPLVGERIYIIDDNLSDDDTAFTFKSHGASQSEAVGSTRYAQLFKIEETSSYYLLQLGKTITNVPVFVPNAKGEKYIKKKIEEAGNQDVYICIQESLRTQDASRGDGSFKFSSIRHEIVAMDYNEDISCPAGSGKYKLATEICKVEVSATSGPSFCEKYPEMSKVLGDIISALQIIVPILVIVLTSLEISKIVIAGNIDEELPKRKKTIIVRLIVMVAFFFLPLITKLFISFATGVSMLSVDCIFNNGQKTENSELVDCVDVDNLVSTGEEYK